MDEEVEQGYLIEAELMAGELFERRRNAAGYTGESERIISEAIFHQNRAIITLLHMIERKL